MTKQSLLIIIILFLITILLGYNYFAQPFANLNSKNQQASVENTESQAAVVLSPEETYLAQLSSKQKVAQLLAVPITVDARFENPEIASTSSRVTWIQNTQPGTVTLFGTAVSTKSATAVTSLFKNSELGSPLIAVDHEGGSVQRLSGSGFSPLASWRQICQKNQVDAQFELEQSIEELDQVGIDIVFAPVLDASDNNPALGSRTCSSDFELVQSRAKLAANILYKHDILPVFKHFPGIGLVTTDLHRSFATVVVGEEQAKLYRDMFEFYNDKTVGVMISHAGVENQDPTIPCSLSSNCVGQLADNFSNVLLFTDDILMESAKYVFTGEKLTLEQIALRAITAGNNQVVIGPGISDEELTQLVAALVDAYETNTFFQKRVDEKVLKVLQYKAAK